MLINVFTILVLFFVLRCISFFYQLEVVYRYRGPQLQVGKNY